MPNQIDAKQLQAANDALVAFGSARSYAESMRVCRDYRDALLSDAALLLVEQRIADGRASGDESGAAQLARTYYELRSRLESPEFMELVHSVLAREQP